MIEIGKVLYILNDDLYLHIENKDIVVKKKREIVSRMPYTMIQQIIIFGNTSISNYFIKFCSECNILVSFMSSYGGYYGRIQGKAIGNVLLRKRQYKVLESFEAVAISKNILLGKGLNSINFLEYHRKKNNFEKISKVISDIRKLILLMTETNDMDILRGFEGKISELYFSCFDDILIPEEMKFVERSRRPPKNYCNALLSFLYTMFGLNCTSGCESFGLDSYVGFLHSLRPGRESLSLDLIEEFRSCVVNRFVIRIINQKSITSTDFEMGAQGIKLVDGSRKKLLEMWERYKEEKVYYELYDKDIPIKLLPFLQAQLLSQYIRGDIKEYPPYVLDYRR